MVCSGSFDFQDKICEGHNQSYGTGLSLTHRLPLGTAWPAPSRACEGELLLMGRARPC